MSANSDHVRNHKYETRNLEWIVRHLNIPESAYPAMSLIIQKNYPVPCPHPEYSYGRTADKIVAELNSAITISKNVRKTKELYLKFLESPRWDEIKRQVRIRDNYKCKWCYATDQLEVHHLYYHMGWDHLPACVLLCSDCHRGHHRKYN